MQIQIWKQLFGKNQTIMIKLRRVISEALALKINQILHRMYTIPHKGEKCETEKKNQTYSGSESYEG